MNNKRLGTEFEKECVEFLKNNGYWVHFIAPDNRGAQPFDIIAVKNNNAYAIDCKTCQDKKFSINRIEDNQFFAFNKWMMCGNKEPSIWIKHKKIMYAIPWHIIVDRETVNLEDDEDIKRYVVR